MHEFDAVRRRLKSKVVFAKNESDVLRENELENKNATMLITYCFSTLARGIDFAEYDFVALSSYIYKPTCAYPVHSLESLEKISRQERINTILQSAGRILRKYKDQPAVKVVLCYHLNDESEFEDLAQALKSMSIAPIETYWKRPFVEKEHLFHVINAALEHGRLPTDAIHSFEDLLQRIRSIDEVSVTEFKKRINYKMLATKLSEEQLTIIDGLLPHGKKKAQSSKSKEIRKEEKKANKATIKKIATFMTLSDDVHQPPDQALTKREISLKHNLYRKDYKEEVLEYIDKYSK